MLVVTFYFLGFGPNVTGALNKDAGLLPSLKV